MTWNEQFRNGHPAMAQPAIDRDPGAFGKEPVIGETPKNFYATRLAFPRFAWKRILDFLLSSFFLIALLPVLIAIVVLIRMTSRGPAILTQVRYGQGGKLFNMYKFRTMIVEATDASALTQTIANDPRVTPFGRFLRRTNLDELPQLFNVLSGHMSLVGPRPHPPGMRAGGMLYEALVPDYFDRLRVKPGITGLAQVNGYRGPTLDAGIATRRIELDNTYVRNFSIRLDLDIIARTVMREMGGGGTGF